MSQSLSQKVLAFQTHVGAPTPAWNLVESADLGLEVARSDILATTAGVMQHYSYGFKKQFKNGGWQPYLRIELILEELSELLTAIATKNEPETLDALVDLAYVVIGTATQLDLPFDAAFDEVHRSNMTKDSAAAKHSGTKGKGAGFIAANIQDIITTHRKAQANAKI